MRILITSALFSTLVLSLAACGGAVVDGGDVSANAGVSTDVSVPSGGAAVVNSAEDPNAGGYVTPPAPPPPPQGAVVVNAAPGDVNANANVDQNGGAVVVNAR